MNKIKKGNWQEQIKTAIDSLPPDIAASVGIKDVDNKKVVVTIASFDGTPTALDEIMVDYRKGSLTMICMMSSRESEVSGLDQIEEEIQKQILDCMVANLMGIEKSICYQREDGTKIMEFGVPPLGEPEPT